MTMTTPMRTSERLAAALLTVLTLGSCSFGASFSTRGPQEPENLANEDAQTPTSESTATSAATSTETADTSTTVSTAATDAADVGAVAMPVLDGDAIVLSQPLVFIEGAATLSQNAGNEQALAELVAYLNQYEKISLLRIEGHASNVGDESANLALSGQRAAVVKRYLVDQGIQDSRLLAVGFGGTRPVMTNDTQDNPANDQRTEFRIAGIGGKARLGLDPLAGGTEFE